MAHCAHGTKHFRDFVEEFFPEAVSPSSSRRGWNSAPPAVEAAKPLRVSKTTPDYAEYPSLAPSQPLVLPATRQISQKRYSLPTAKQPPRGRRKTAPAYLTPAPVIVVELPSPAPVARRPQQQTLSPDERLSKVQRQKNKAFEENPNLFTKQTMLYVEAYIAKKRLPLFIDTGAQASVMSLETCKELGLEDQVDLTESGIAAGVGLARIHGKLWRVPVSIGRTQFTMQFNILDMHGVRVILGLDQMKRLGMTIDLTRNGLVVGKDFISFLTLPPADDSKPPPCAIM